METFWNISSLSFLSHLKKMHTCFRFGKIHWLMNFFRSQYFHKEFHHISRLEKKIKKQASSLWYLMHEVGYSNICISPPSSNSSITYWQPFSCTINLPLSRCGKSENFSPYASYILGKGPTFMALRQMSFPGHESQKRCILSAADVFPFLL